MARAYVTEQEYRDWAGDQSVSVPARVLVRASSQVDSYLVSAVYATDANGYPTEASVAEAIELATLEQIYAILINEKSRETIADNPLGQTLKSATIDGVTWTASEETSSSVPVEYRLLRSGSRAGTVLCPAALLHLAQVPRSVVVYG